MSHKFIGYSPENNFTEALEDAIAKAKQDLSTDYVSWSLSFMRGDSGGFVLTRDLYIGIEASQGHRIAMGPAYFEMIDATEKSFIIKLVSPEQIDLARRIIAGDEKERTHVQGIIVKKPASYNPGWSFHLDPSTINFFAFAIEVCDAASGYVEENLDEAGGSFLPGNHWCPWSSKLVKEIIAHDVLERFNASN